MSQSPAPSRAVEAVVALGLLGVQQLSMPDAATAKAATGYERGTITPFGSTRAWPVVADERLAGREVTLGGGVDNQAIAVDADAVVAALGARVGDVTEPEPPRAAAPDARTTRGVR